MTPHLRLTTALRRQPVDQPPFSWGFGPTGEMANVLRRDLVRQGLDWDRLRAVTDDVLSVGPRYVGPALPPGVDIWGIGRQAQSYGNGAYAEINATPLAQADSISAVDDHPWPDPAAWDDQALRAAVAGARQRWGEKAIRVSAGNPFETYSWMTGLEQTMLNLALRPEVVDRALGHIVDYFVARLDRMAAAAGDLVDLWFCADDLGGQHGLLCSRGMYRDVIWPHHCRLHQHIHRIAPIGLVLYHSDGAVAEVLADLIESGIDALEAVQTECSGMDPAGLKERFGDQIGFHGGISVQTWLRFGRPDEVRRECAHLRATLDGGSGGYVAAPSHAVQVGTPTANVMAMLEAVLGPDRLAKAKALARLRTD
ncbi:MAG: hypothetical protein HZB16_06875 [Armatimonadetes bacterium]|nr:hypothetical protein [Armatimonadota bacterium]